MQVTAFLRTSLFSLGGSDAHVPQGAMILDGTTEGPDKGVLVLNLTACRDHRGEKLACSPVRLSIPMSKIDHLLLAD